jgi:hypothetical protein
MSGIARRLTKLEAASGHTAQTVVVFVSFVPGPDLHDTATVDGRVWHREPNDLEEAFQSRVAAEARRARARQGNWVLVAFLEQPCGRYDPGTESRGEAAGRTELTSRSIQH